jgi:hypothetical protein
MIFGGLPCLDFKFLHFRKDGFIAKRSSSTSIAKTVSLKGHTHWANNEGGSKQDRENLREDGQRNRVLALTSLNSSVPVL